MNENEKKLNKEASNPSSWTGPKEGQWPSALNGADANTVFENEEDLFPWEKKLKQWETERDYMPVRPSRETRTGCLGGILYMLFVICAAAAIAVVLWITASDLLALNKTAESVEVTLPSSAFVIEEVDITDENGNVTGSKTVHTAKIDQVASLLKDYGIINYKWLFKLYSQFSDADQKIDPGTYQLSTNLDYRAVVTKLQVGSGSQMETTVMFPEGYNMDQIFAKLEENEICSAADLYKAAAETEFGYSFLTDLTLTDAYRLEGYLFPDTYNFYQGMQASSAINKFISNFNYRITDEMLQQCENLGLTLNQVLTVASLIEKEAGNENERALIASVIYNRLNAGMLLQFDSTVVYALRAQGITDLTTDLILNTDSPYNTYLYAGLPQGPICNPGLASIEAALNPATTDYYYFAMDTESKTMVFFNNAADHAAFVATQDYGG